MRRWTTNASRLAVLAVVLLVVLWLARPAGHESARVADAPHASDAGEAELAGRGQEPSPTPPSAPPEKGSAGQEPSEEEILEALSRGGGGRVKPPAQGVRVTGRVLLTGTDAPVAGATVMTWTATKRERTCEAAVTVADGAFTLEPVAMREPVWIVARAEGLHPVAVRETFHADQDGVVIRVGGGGTLEGRVTQADGTPAVDLEVWLVRPGAPLPPRREGRMWFMPGEGHLELFCFYYTQVRTDADGRYVFRGVPLDQDRLPVAKLSANADVPGEVLRFERDGETLMRDIRIARPASLTVRVFDAEGTIVSDGQVDLETPRIWFSGSDDGRRLPDGGLRVEGLVPGTWKVRAWMPGTTFVEREVVLSEGADETIELRAAAGLVLEGQVVDARGEPVAAAQIGFEGPDSRMGNTDLEGHFRLTGLPDAAGRLDVSYDPALAMFARLEAGLPLTEDPLTADPRRLAAVRLENVRPGGKPLRVVLPDSGVLRGRFRGVEPGVQLQEGFFSKALTGPGTATVPADGVYRRAVSWPAVPFLLVFKAPDGRVGVCEVEALDAGEDHDLDDIVLAPALDLHGVVVNEGGRPVEGARVRLTQEWAEQEVRTDGRGAFHLAGLLPLRLWMRIDAPGYPPAFRVLDARADDKPEIRLSKGGILELHVVDADGAPFGAGTFWIDWDIEMRYVSGYGVLSGYYRLDPSGTTQLRCEAARYRVRVYDEKQERHAEATVEIRESETTVVEVRLERNE